MKKPFYKRWWFIVIAILFGLTLLGAIFGEEAETTKDEDIEQEKVETSASSTVEEKEEVEEVKEETKEQPEHPKVEQKNESKQETKQKVNEPEWQTKIKEIANNSDTAADKYYAVEKFMMEYREKVTDDEVEQFKNDIINDYKSGTYLSEPNNHERMLTNIFKSYIIERKTDGNIKDFAFDYQQNLKYVYRGVDTVDSEAVKSNEHQMNKALEQIK